MKGRGGQNLLAAFRHKEYPFYALQYHPEASQFTTRDDFGRPKTLDSVIVGR